MRYFPAPAVQAVAERLIDMKLPELRNIQIGYVYRSRAAVKDGVATLGRCRKQSQPAKVAHGLDYQIEIAHDQWEKINDHCREALVYHELMHVAVSEDEKNGKTKLGIRKHDCEMFFAELHEYGPWTMALETVVEAAKGLQLDLFGEATTRLRNPAEAGSNGTAATSGNGDRNAATVVQDGSLQLLMADGEPQVKLRYGTILTAHRDIAKNGSPLLEAGQKIQVARIQRGIMETTDGIKIARSSWDGLAIDPADPQPDDDMATLIAKEPHLSSEAEI